MTTATATLTRIEAAYLHLASFERGDLVDIEGRQVRYQAVVMVPQQGAPPATHAGMRYARLTASSNGTEVEISVGALLDGQNTITRRGDSVRYFDLAGYEMQNPEG